MVLQFQPPPDWLIQNYLTKQSPVVEGLQGLSAISQAYLKQKGAKKQEDLAQEAKDIEMAKGISAGGQDFSDAYSRIVSSRNAPTAVPSNQTSSLIDRAKAFFGGAPVGKAPVDTGMPDPSLPPAPSTGTASGYPPPIAADAVQPPITNSPLTDPLVQEYQKDPIAFKAKHGNDAIKRLREQALTDKLLGDQTKGPEGYYDASGNKKFTLPAGSKILPDKLDVGTRQDQFDQKEWDKLVKDTNPLTASSRSTLGMASKANFQADRALVTLSKPVVTNQEAGNVMADIAAIYQTGSPTQYGMSHQEYSTLYGKVQGALQSVTGKPQDALPDAIKQRLVGVLHDMKGTNGLVLKQQLDYTEKAKRRLIGKFPQEWADIRSTLENNPDSPGQTTIPGTGPHGASVSQNGQIYNWNPKTGQYE